MATNPSVIQSVYTDGLMQLVYTNTDWIIDGIYITILKKKQFNDVEVFAGDFTYEITEEFKPGSPYNDVTNSPSEWPMKSPIEGVRWWFHL
jgi:hypothetical protein